ncbi:MAG: hydroxyacid dehydrogenase [Campylobacteraceae bacterium 4484_4]|nr:MAG: hydroxyacid dehydrogenase [Campylobacteraceae bacterium 4484_4]
MKIVILDQKTLGDDIDLNCFSQYGKVESYPVTTGAETISRLQGADIAVTNKVVIDKEIMDATDLKLICVAATGMNNIDLEYAAKKGIIVKNVAGYSTPSVVQTTFSIAFYLIGKLRYLDNYTKGEGWVQSEIFTHLEKPFFEITGKRWGIIGLGTIGKEVARVARAFGAEAVYYSTSGRNRNREYPRMTLEDLLQSSDIVSIHAPLNEQTKNLINKKNLPLLKSGALLLNLGRGGIVNEADLAEFLDQSNIMVGLDVLEKEPMSPDNPLRFVKAKERLFITPHIAWASREARERLVAGICENIASFLKGDIYEN